MWHPQWQIAVFKGSYSREVKARVIYQHSHWWRLKLNCDAHLWLCSVSTVQSIKLQSFLLENILLYVQRWIQMKYIFIYAQRADLQACSPACVQNLLLCNACMRECLSRAVFKAGFGSKSAFRPSALLCWRIKQGNKTVKRTRSRSEETEDQRSLWLTSSVETNTSLSRSSAGHV